MLSVLKPINLAATFLLELAMLAAFAYWGVSAGQSTLAKIGLGIGVPVIIAIAWGIFMAPKSSRRLPGAAYLILKILLFGLAVAALIVAGQLILGIIFGVLFFLNTILLLIWRQ